MKTFITTSILALGIAFSNLAHADELTQEVIVQQEKEKQEEKKAKKSYEAKEEKRPFHFVGRSEI